MNYVFHTHNYLTLNKHVLEGVFSKLKAKKLGHNTSLLTIF